MTLHCTKNNAQVALFQRFGHSLAPLDDGWAEPALGFFLAHMLSLERYRNPRAESSSPSLDLRKSPRTITAVNEANLSS